jgi:hypothetical protein
MTSLRRRIALGVITTGVAASMFAVGAPRIAHAARDEGNAQAISSHPLTPGINCPFVSDKTANFAYGSGIATVYLDYFLCTGVNGITGNNYSQYQIHVDDNNGDLFGDSCNNGTMSLRVWVDGGQVPGSPYKGPYETSDHPYADDITTENFQALFPPQADDNNSWLLETNCSTHIPLPYLHF